LSRKRVVVIEGEDAAPEAVRPSVELLDGLGLEIDWIHPPVGQRGIDATGSPFPPEARAAIDDSDATMFGATSGLSAPALFYLRWGKQTYANLRPARYLPGYRSPLAQPQEIDLAIVRENLEDMYVAVEGELAELAPLELQSPTARRPVADLGRGRYAIKVITEEGTDRVARFAFELARRRKAQGLPGQVTCGTKHNMLRRSDGLFRERVQAIASDYPDVEFESLIIDDLANKLSHAAHAFDVIVLPNLYGDILSDAVAGLIGGLGVAPSGCYGDDYAYFEAAHGTAPDIAGKNIINPTATLLSAVLMLEYLGFETASARLERAIEQVYTHGIALTPDQGGTATTGEFCQAVVRELER
jgi:isocitrate/isopropylmalate dehydrogenase